MHGARTRARAAMQEQHGTAERLAHLLPIHDVATRQRQVAGLVRSDFGEEVASGHRRGQAYTQSGGGGERPG